MTGNSRAILSGQTLRRAILGFAVTATFVILPALLTPAGAEVSPKAATITRPTTTTTTRLDTVAPTCNITAVRRPGPSGMDEKDVTVRDTFSGLASITNITASNATIVYEPFEVGTTGPVIVTTFKTVRTMVATWAYDVTDVAGNVRRCSFGN